jgi:hypothetical protein
MPTKTIEAEINGTRRTITADIPEGATQDQIMGAVQQYVQANPLDNLNKPGPGLGVKMGANAAEKKNAIDPAQLRRALPTIGGFAGGLAAAPFTGGMSAIPAALAGAGMAGAGGFAGSMIEQGLEPGKGDIKEAIKRAAGEGAVQGAMDLTGRIFVGALSKYLKPEHLYKSALKPTISTTAPERAAQTVRTGIKEGLVLKPKPETLGIVRKRFKDLGESIQRVIDAKPGGASPYQNVTNRLNQLRQTWSKDPVAGKQFVDRIDEAERQFILQHGNPAPITKQVSKQVPSNLVDSTGKPVMKTVKQTITINPEDMSLSELRQQAQPISLQKLQQIKKQGWQTLRASKKSAFDPEVDSGVAIETRQAITSSIKEVIEHYYPGIKGMNQDYGEIRELYKQVARFVQRETNKQALPYIPFVTAGAGMGERAIGRSAAPEFMATALAIARNALENPAIKSRIAIALDRVNRVKGVTAMGKELPGVALKAGYGAITSDNQQTDNQQ